MNVINQTRSDCKCIQYGTLCGSIHPSCITYSFLDGFASDLCSYAAERDLRDATPRRNRGSTTRPTEDRAKPSTSVDHPYYIPITYWSDSLRASSSICQIQNPPRGACRWHVTGHTYSTIWSLKPWLQNRTLIFFEYEM